MKKEQYKHFVSEIKETNLATFSFSSQELVYCLIIIIIIIVLIKCKVILEIFLDWNVALVANKCWRRFGGCGAEFGRCRNLIP